MSDAPHTPVPPSDANAAAPPSDTATPPSDAAGITALAARHGLDVDPASVRVEELGLDFRVAFARAADGEDWVLRIPRRPDVLARAEVEARLLRMVGPRLDVAVPDWRVHTPELIAYPLLPGLPGLEMTAAGEVEWRVDMTSTVYAASLGDVVAQLHGLDPAEAEATGIDVRTPEQVREFWRRDLERVAAEFRIAPELRERWEAWIGEDRYWPQHTVLTHGELYPAHTLVEGETISAVLDWTTAAIGDPAKDLMFLQVSAPPEVFEVALERYVAGGGQVWDGLAEHCTEMLSASPLGYGLYALETGDADHRAAAAAVLDPPAEG